jgi:hypothetical protein
MSAMARNTKPGSKNDHHLRSALLLYFPMFIATLSVVSSLYQAYLFTRSLDIAQQSVARSEYLRTCSEIINTYFQIKLAVTQGPRNEAANLVGKFGALGTYLANFQDDAIRARYTDLTSELGAIAAHSASTAKPESRFEKADRLFTQMNDDCARLAQVVRM